MFRDQGAVPLPLDSLESRHVTHASRAHIMSHSSLCNSSSETQSLQVDNTCFTNHWVAKTKSAH